MVKKDPKQTMLKFEARQSRQLLAIAVTLFLVLLCAVLYKRPGLFGDVSNSTLIGSQIAGIAAFLAFTAFNWRCPSCNKGLGSNINKRICKKCGARLR